MILATLNRMRIVLWSLAIALCSAAQSAEAEPHVAPAGETTGAHFVSVRADLPVEALPIPRPDDGPTTASSLRIQNIGAKRLSSLRVYADRDFTSARSISLEATKGLLTDREKAEALWNLVMDYTYHYFPADGGMECHDAAKLLNIYGYGFCDDTARVLAGLWREVGLKSRVWGLAGHVVPEVYYDDAWHLYDPDLRVCYTAPDGGRVLSLAELEAAPEIVESTPSTHNDASVVASLYASTEDNVASSTRVTRHRIRFDLEPGESIEFVGEGDEFFRSIYETAEAPPWKSAATFDFSLQEYARHGGAGYADFTNLRPMTSPSGETMFVSPEGLDPWGRLRYHRRSPYVMLSAHAEMDVTLESEVCSAELIVSNKSGTRRVFHTVKGPHRGPVRAALPSDFVYGKYEYTLSLRLRGPDRESLRLTDFSVKTVCQAAPTATLSMLGDGRELFILSDEPVGGEAEAASKAGDDAAPTGGLELRWTYEPTSKFRSSD